MLRLTGVLEHGFAPGKTLGQQAGSRVAQLRKVRIEVGIGFVLIVQAEQRILGSF